MCAAASSWIDGMRNGTGVEEATKARRRLSEAVAGDGYRLIYPVWEGAAWHATVVLVHGVMSHSAWLRNVAESLASRDYKVIGAERRGSGLNRIGRGDAPSRDMLVRDLWRIVDQEHDHRKPLFLVGWCWGAVLALAASVDASDRLEGLMFLA